MKDFEMLICPMESKLILFMKNLLTASNIFNSFRVSTQHCLITCCATGRHCFHLVERQGIRRDHSFKLEVKILPNIVWQGWRRGSEVSVIVVGRLDRWSSFSYTNSDSIASLA